MTTYTFNTTPIEYGPKVGEVPVDQLPSCPTLRRASLQDALLFGGPLVAACLQSAPLVGDRKFTLVDTKVAMLLPGFIPAIPGWHTDGVPRRKKDPNWSVEWSPFNYGAPSQAEQQKQSDEGYFPRYHSVHVGIDCPTEFLVGTNLEDGGNSGLAMDLEHGEDEELYREMGEKMGVVVGNIEMLKASRKPIYGNLFQVMRAPYGQWLSWDWWQIHRATPAQERGWRLWIRVTEGDDPPSNNFIMRSQTQIYVVSEDQAW